MQPRRAPIVALTALALALSAAPRASNAQTSASTPSAADRAEAQRLYGEGAAAFGAGRYDEAARLFREAYQRQQAGALLFNLGRAEEAAGHDEAAIEAYERFLRAEPTSSDRPAVEQSLATLRGRVAERRAREQREQQQRDEQARREEESQRARAEEERQRRERELAASRRSPSVVPPVVLGVGLATIGAGGVVALLASGAYERARVDPVQQSAFEGAQQADTLATVANVLFGVGGALTAAGVVWTIIDRVGASRPERRALVVPSVGGLSVVGRF